MSAALRLARRDLRGGWSGLGLLWLCLALSLAGLAAVTSLASAIDRAIAGNAQALLGGDLLLSLAQRDANEAERAALSDLGRLSRRQTMRAMLVTADGESALAELSGVDAAFPLAGELRFEPGGTRPRGREIAIDRLLAERLGVGRGAMLGLGGKPFRVSAVIAAMPSGGGFALAPPALVDEAGLAASGLVQPGSLVTTRYAVMLSGDPEAAGAAFQRKFPDGGWRAVGRAEASSGTRRLVDRLGQMMGLVALAALAIGGLGTASAAAAFAQSRRPRIAILKLLGAGRATISAMLAVELGAIAGLAILVALGIGAATPWLVGDAVAGLIPVKPDPAPQWAALGLTALFGGLIAFAASIGPLREAAATRPARLLRGEVAQRDKVAAWPALAATALAAALAIFTARDATTAAIGLAAMLAVAGLFALVGLGIRRASRRARHLGGPLVRLAIAALDRPGAATVRLAVSLGLGLSLLVALGGAASSLLSAIASESQARAPALFLLDIPAAERAKFEGLAKLHHPGSELRLVPSLRGPVTAVNGTAVVDLPSIPEGAWILRGDRGLTFAATLPPANRIVAGRWWPANYRGPPLISLDADAAEALGLKVGDRMTIAVMGRPIEARIASLRTIDWRSLGFNFAIIFDPDTLRGAPFGYMASLAIDGGGSTLAFERALARDLPMVSAIRVAEIVSQVQAMIAAIEGAVRIAAGFALLVGMVVLAGSVVATRRARQRDLVLLRLAGATRSEAGLTQALEFLILAMAAALAAALVGTVATWAICRFQFEVPFVPGWTSLAILPLAAVALASLAAIAAALPPLLARPAAALRDI